MDQNELMKQALAKKRGQGLHVTITVAGADSVKSGDKPGNVQGDLAPKPEQAEEVEIEDPSLEVEGDEVIGEPQAEEGIDESLTKDMSPQQLLMMKEKKPSSLMERAQADALKRMGK